MISPALAAAEVTANARVSEAIDPLIIERMELGLLKHPESVKLCKPPAGEAGAFEALSDEPISPHYPPH